MWRNSEECSHAVFYPLLLCRRLSTMAFRSRKCSRIFRNHLLSKQVRTAPDARHSNVAHRPTTSLTVLNVSREWALIVPTWICIVVVYLFWVYERCDTSNLIQCGESSVFIRMRLEASCSYNMMSVPSKQSWSNIADPHSKFAAEHESFPGVQGNIPSLQDIPPHITSRRLHLQCH